MCQEQFVWHPFEGDYNDNDDDDDDGTLLQVMMVEMMKSSFYVRVDGKPQPGSNWKGKSFSPGQGQASAVSSLPHEEAHGAPDPARI